MEALLVISTVSFTALAALSTSATVYVSSIIERWESVLAMVALMVTRLDEGSSCFLDVAVMLKVGSFKLAGVVKSTSLLPREDPSPLDVAFTISVYSVPNLKPPVGFIFTVMGLFWAGDCE